MASFVIQKVQNKDFAHWRENTENDIPHPYEWVDLGHGFGVAGCAAATYLNRTCMYLPSGNHHIDQFMIIQNNSLQYTLKLDYASLVGGSPTAGYAIKQYNTDGGLLVTTDLSAVNLTEQWATFTKTLGPAGSDLVFHADTTAIVIWLKRGTYNHYCTNVQLLGRSFTLNKGFDLPVDNAPLIIQKSSETISGDLLSANYYHTPLKQVIIKTSKMRSVDANNFKIFLQDTDIEHTAGTLLFTDDDGNEYFGQFTEVQKMTATEFQNVNFTCTFQELG